MRATPPHPQRVFMQQRHDASLRTSLEEARRHATLPRSWIQRENWEFETHRRW